MILDNIIVNIIIPIENKVSLISGISYRLTKENIAKSSPLMAIGMFFIILFIIKSILLLYLL